MKITKKIMILCLAAIGGCSLLSFASCIVLVFSESSFSNEESTSSESSSNEESTSSESSSSNEKSAYEVLVSNQELLVVKATNVTGTVSLKDAMTALQKEGKLTYTISNGMVTSINGVENPADYSSCWMFYSDLGEYDGVTYTNTEWGTYTYGETNYASNAYGVESMPVVNGYTYIAHYDTF
jgi:hypothetical protein